MDQNLHSKPIMITSDQIQKIPPFRGGPRKSKDWAHEGEHHLTIGPSGGVEWARRLKEDGDIHHSTDCITTQNKDASSSDSDLLKSGTTSMWPPSPRSSAPGTSAAARLHRAHINNASPPGTVAGHSKAQPTQEKKHEEVTPAPTSGGETSLSDSSRTVSSAEDEAAAAQRAAEELAAKKTRVKQSLMKRARSVAIFSLKLKERRAREAQEKAAKQSVSPTVVLPPPQMGGEMACIPIEKVSKNFLLRNR